MRYYFCWGFRGNLKSISSVQGSSLAFFQNDEVSLNSTCQHRCFKTLSLLRVINVKLSLQLHQKYFITQHEELGFSWLIQMKEDYTSNSHYLTYTFLLKGWENVLYNFGSRVTHAVHSFFSIKRRLHVANQLPSIIFRWIFLCTIYPLRAVQCLAHANRMTAGNLIDIRRR